jgi:hypothetical protein
VISLGPPLRALLQRRLRPATAVAAGAAAGVDADKTSAAAEAATDVAHEPAAPGDEVKA